MRACGRRPRHPRRSPPPLGDSPSAHSSSSAPPAWTEKTDEGKEVKQRHQYVKYHVQLYNSWPPHYLSFRIKMNLQADDVICDARVQFSMTTCLCNSLRVEFFGKRSDLHSVPLSPKCSPAKASTYLASKCVHWLCPGAKSNKCLFHPKSFCFFLQTTSDSSVRN